MKKFLLIAFTFIVCNAGAQKMQLKKIWETDSILAIPESVLPDIKKGVLYISLINGGPWDTDGKGGIGKLSVNGKKYDSTWITGLHAPKGMAIAGNRLYTADVYEVVVIDIQNGIIEKRIGIDSATGLNDVTVDDRGIVYVSDSRTSKIWRIENDVATLYLENMKGVNGLKAVGTDLFIGSGKTFIKADSQKQLTTIAEVTQGIDGIEPSDNGSFILSSWIGYIYYVKGDGTFDILLESHAEKINAADIGYDPVLKVIYVPTFFRKNIVAYKLLPANAAMPADKQKSSKKIKTKSKVRN